MSSPPEKYDDLGFGAKSQGLEDLVGGNSFPESIP
jgi:hypothetical protein